MTTPTTRPPLPSRPDRTTAARPFARGLFALLLGLLVTGCDTPTLGVRPVRYDLDVGLDPARHELAARIELELALLAEPPAGRTRAELLLNRGLTVRSVAVEGATLVSWREAPPAGSGDDTTTPARLVLVLDDPGETLRVDLAYDGVLHQDVTAGEVQGEVHNFAVSAHVGEEGIYLEPDGYWYPRIEMPAAADPDLGLASFTLAVDPPAGFELVAGLESRPSADGRPRWQSPFPLDGLVLLGGPLERFTRVHDGITLHAVLAPGKAAVAEDILTASAELLDRYQPLVGPYPYTEFTVLEAFFSSGFAFPTCTQIAGSQLSEHRQYRRHGYLDHELLHNWWGNGVLVDPRDGNWCEGLTAYLTNYGGYVLDGDPEGARRQRRNQSNFLSSIDEARERPLGTFDLPDGADRGIGYFKGSAVFHLLEREVGAETLLAALRRVREENLGRHAGWEVLRAAAERESGRDLSGFFDQWVRGTGAPLLELVDAAWSPGDELVEVTLSQGSTRFALDVPLRLVYGERAVDVVAQLNDSEARIEVPTEPLGLTAIELDPDYHLFRKLRPRETMPTANLTRGSDRLVVVLPAGEVAAPYRAVADSFRRAVLGDEDAPEEGHEVIERTVTDLTAGELEGRSVLILGDAVRSRAVADLLERAGSPVRWEADRFLVEDRAYPGAGQAVFFTVHHPEKPEAGITVYFGNSAVALSNAGVLAYYPNSLLVFDTPTGATADASGMPPAVVVERRDFEFHDRIDL